MASGVFTWVGVGYGIDQNPHSGGGTNGVNVATLNPGTFELPTLYDLLYEIPVFWAVVELNVHFPCMHGESQGTQYKSQIFVMGYVGRSGCFRYGIWKMGGRATSTDV